MNAKSIILGVIVCIILYITYLYIFNEKGKVINKFNNAEQNLHVAKNALPPGGNSQYTWSVWFYVNQWNYKYGEEKVIFRRGSRNTPSPSVFFDPFDNTLHIGVTVYPSEQSSSGKEIFDCAVPNMPIQTWTNVIIALNTRSLDVYLQGKLVKTCVLPGVARHDVNNSDLALTPDGGFSGFTAMFRYLDYAVNPQEAYNIYKEGYGDSLLGKFFNKYKLQINVKNKNTVTHSWTI